jgi:hypothetical protein
MPNTSPNMNLPVPVVSTELSPAWATDINACMAAIDSHNHSTGQGVAISQDGISLTAASTTFDSLNFNTSNAYALRTVRFTAQASALALSTDKGCIYEAGVDLYYNDGNGNQIRLTQGGSIVGTAGSITGLPSGTASAAFSGGTFVWQSATNTAANMDAGSYILRNNTVSSKGLTLNPPNAMAADYGLTLPSIPGSTKILICDTSGNITASYTVDNSTITIASNVIGVPAGGITATQIATGTITNTQVNAAAAIARSKLEAVGQQVSSSCGSFSTASTSYVDVTNLTATITTDGRPIMALLIPDGTTSESSIAFVSGNTVSRKASFQILRGATVVGVCELKSRAPVYTATVVSSANSIFVPPGAIAMPDVVVAGTYTYKLQAKIDNADSSAQVNNAKLFVYPLG